MIIIKKLTKELAPAYLDLFDNRAFGPDDNNGPCYCTSPTMSPAVEQKMVNEFGADVKATLRKYAEIMLQNEQIPGYLAFDGDVAIGWCNAGDSSAYVNANNSHFMNDFIREHINGKTISIMCFEIVPSYRGQGIASAFLTKIISDATDAGYEFVEGYANVLYENAEYDMSFTGPVPLYKKLGFVEVARKDDKIIMRKALEHQVV